MRVIEHQPQAGHRGKEGVRLTPSGEAALADAGRVLIRYSGTEPKLRILVEGRDAARIDQILQNIEKAVRSDLAVIED